MAKKKTVNKKEKTKKVHRPNKSKIWEVKDGKVIRNNRECRKCGAGVFLAKHYNRMTCGKCGNTEFSTPTSKKTTKTVGGVKTTSRRRRIQR
jgi:small subunit ribosomal protein S27Ae